MNIILKENESRAKVIEALAYAAIVIRNNANEWKESSEESDKPEEIRNIERDFYESDLEYAAIIDKLLNNV